MLWFVGCRVIHDGASPVGDLLRREREEEAALNG